MITCVVMEVLVKKGFLTLAFLALPTLCGSGEYTRKIKTEAIVENKGGCYTVKQRSALSKRIEQFVRQHGVDPNLAVEMAELLETLENGKVLAAIAATESGFDIKAEGWVGEIGAYQVRPEFWGCPGDTFKSQTEQANSILEELLKASNGDLESALEKYNGKGQKSRMYATAVLSLISSI